MPTADSFTALGAGNGFPFCCSEFSNIYKIDITSSNYSNSKWTTLSGVNSDNYNSFDDATLSQKVDSSRDMAMRIYWNKFRTTGLRASSSGSYQETVGSTGSVDGFSWNYTDTGMGIDDVEVPEPINRICTPQDGSTIKQLTYEDDFGIYARIDNYFFDNKGRLYAFYDSDKFLGYGSNLTVTGVNNPYWFHCWIHYVGIVQSPQSDVDTSFHKRSTDFSTINGMHFVRFREGWIVDKPLPSQFNPGVSGYSNEVSSPSISLMTNGVQLAYIYGWNYYYPGGEFIDPYTSYESMNLQASIDGPGSIEFYTY